MFYLFYQAGLGIIFYYDIVPKSKDSTLEMMVF